jgi:hypothetical protein
MLLAGEVSIFLTKKATTMLMAAPCMLNVKDC